MSGEYPKKFWWVVLVLVPIAVAVIGIMPSLLEKMGRSSTQGTTQHEGPEEKEVSQETNSRAVPEESLGRSTGSNHSVAALEAAKYVNPSVANQEGIKEVALLITDEDGKSLLGLEQDIANLLTRRGADPVHSFFTEAFVQEGYARALFSGGWDLAQELELATRVDYLILGFARVSYISNPQYEGLWTANLGLQLKCFDFRLQRICGTRSVVVSGAGYSQQTALENAVKGIRPQIESYIQETF